MMRQAVDMSEVLNPFTIIRKHKKPASKPCEPLGEKEIDTWKQKKSDERDEIIDLLTGDPNYTLYDWGNLH